MDFIPSLPVFLAFSLALLLLAITPGPDMTLWISRSLRDGRAIGLMTLAGTSFGISIHTLLVAFGISALIVASPTQKRVTAEFQGVAAHAGQAGGGDIVSPDAAEDISQGVDRPDM